MNVALSMYVLYMCLYIHTMSYYYSTVISLHTTKWSLFSSLSLIGNHKDVSEYLSNYADSYDYNTTVDYRVTGTIPCGCTCRTCASTDPVNGLTVLI